MSKSSPKNTYDFYHEVALEELKSGKVDSAIWSKSLAYRGQKSGQTDSFYIMIRVINLYFKDGHSLKNFNLYFAFSVLKLITSAKRFWLAVFSCVLLLSFASTGLLPRYKHARGTLVLDTWTGELHAGEVR